MGIRGSSITTSMLLLAAFLAQPSARAVTTCQDINMTESPPGTCNPAFTDPKRLLMTFHPELHDIAGNTQVIDRGNEIMNGSDVATMIGPYQRKIYACVPPYTVNTSAYKCEFKRENHACSSGAIGGVHPSEVSLEVTGMDATARFDNAVNKKLACCLNEFSSSGTVDSVVKFDCIENVKKHYADFNELWTSSDEDIDGGQMNAFILMSSMGKPLSGFYGFDGTRCAEYNEFAGVIQPGKVSAPNKADAFTSVGLSIEQPTSKGFQFLRDAYLAKGAKIPTTVAEKRRCPILVRAAAQYQCPSNPPPTSYQKNVDVPDGAGGILHRRCSAANSVTVQIRLEQVWEVENMPKMQPIDTVVDAKNASTISVERIIANKYGNQCPPGTTRSGDACVY